MHAAYFRLGGVSTELPPLLLKDIFHFATKFMSRIIEIEELLTRNKIWKQRLINVGVISKNLAINMGFTGVLLRSTGLNFDIRKHFPYEIYNKMYFRVPITSTGDSYGRFLLRIEEMRWSVKIIRQAIWMIPNGLIKNPELSFVNKKNSLSDSMETLINHFKHYTTNTFFKQSHLYTAI